LFVGPACRTQKEKKKKRGKKKMTFSISFAVIICSFAPACKNQQIKQPQQSKHLDDKIFGKQ
jgi:hypothetical protein